MGNNSFLHWNYYVKAIRLAKTLSKNYIASTLVAMNTRHYLKKQIKTSRMKAIGTIADFKTVDLYNLKYLRGHWWTRGLDRIYTSDNKMNTSNGGSIYDIYIMGQDFICQLFSLSEYSASDKHGRHNITDNKSW